MAWAPRKESAPIAKLIRRLTATPSSRAFLTLEAARIEPSGVWEWTSSLFAPYPGFRAYPYAGYSTPWFQTHRVLRGGSWATSPELVRPTLRNWYDAGFREAPTGFRCAGGK